MCPLLVDLQWEDSKEHDEGWALALGRAPDGSERELTRGLRPHRIGPAEARPRPRAEQKQGRQGKTTAIPCHHHYRPAVFEPFPWGSEGSPCHLPGPWLPEPLN